MLQTALLSLTLAGSTLAHIAAWAPGMYCRGGSDPNIDNQNTNDAVNPLYNLTKEDWWFQHDRGCDIVPPRAGEFLEVPANGNFTVELAHNRASTTLSYDGRFVTAWPDGGDHPENWNGWNTEGTPAVCLKDDGAMHAYNESSAAGTAFAISYNSDIEDVTMENLVVFTTLYHTPWKRLATYQVPNLPQCPEDGCHCAWLWVPSGCGEPNMYMQGFKCKVTGATSTSPLSKAQVPAFCEDDQSKCVKGAKQMLAWHQKTGNNIETKPGVTPNYNQKCGWAEGAQTDIFESAALPTSIIPPSNGTSQPVTSTSSAVVSVMPVDATIITSLLHGPNKSLTTLATSTVIAKDYTSAILVSSATSTIVSTAAPVANTTIGHYNRPTRKLCSKGTPRARARAAVAAA
ncbi:hypothetical protein CC78DRAFT_92548 [Lojkania enalia]|uniref:Proteophosphoglycan ppg4 n=1 Tax=Lojkania enalia TaxID=147567 RepID=A0A9P4KFT8_9PLEO|nr:hypothetical protein CC78DRAFT_92548 [Didymosphaeria enalia]